MGAFVYVLQSKSGRLYYGSTTDLNRRLEQHARGHTCTTAKDAPWKLAASREVPTLEVARKLERRFKLWKNPRRVLVWFERGE
jgi:putative endonuclease